VLTVLLFEIYASDYQLSQIIMLLIFTVHHVELKRLTKRTRKKVFKAPYTKLEYVV